jgi:EAL and modified HD-GYP domain-containing signal transduction protein
MTACHALKQQAYLIALDDYVADDWREPLAEMADIIKVDLQLTTPEQRDQLIKQFGPWRCRMLAEKVETQTQFEQARDQGFVYFQGYFVRRPEMMGTHDMPANQLNYIRMLQEVSRPELNVPGAGEADQGRGVDLLSAHAVSEFGGFRA